MNKVEEMRLFRWGLAFALLASAMSLDGLTGPDRVLILIAAGFAAFGSDLAYVADNRLRTRYRDWSVRRDERRHDQQMRAHQRTQGLVRSTLPRQIDPEAKVDVIVSVEPSDDAINAAVLGVTNHGLSDDFQVQVVGWGQGGAPHPCPPVSLKWKTGVVVQRIAPGITEYLEIARLHREAAPDYVIDGKPREGIAIVAVDWTHDGYLGAHSYWKAEDFETRIWSLEVVASAAAAAAPKHQGVRLHLFGKTKDHPIERIAKAGWVMSHPTLRASLFILAAPPT